MVAPQQSMTEGREERVARYKEDRRRELAAQFGSREQQTSSVRTTRASRLRTQANQSPKAPPSPDGVKQKCDSLTLESFSRQVAEGAASAKDKLSRRASFNQSQDRSHAAPSSLPYLVDRRKEGIRKGRPSGGSSPSNGTSSPYTSLGYQSPVPRSSQLVRKVTSIPKKSLLPPETAPITITKEEVRTASPAALVTPIQTSKRNKFGKGKSFDSELHPNEAKPNKRPQGILKKSTQEDTSTPPVSILKRKSSKEEVTGGRWSETASGSRGWSDRSRTGHSSTTQSKARGILKKHRSLDEPALPPTEHLSFQNGIEECRPILRNQSRRCSLEELKRNQSPESQVQGILKRKTSREESTENEICGLPQGILKTKNVSPVHAGPSSPARESPPVTESTRPILKKKSHSEELPESSVHDLGPRPILKKSSFDEEELPVKPILKTKTEEIPCCDIKPILKHTEESSTQVSLRHKSPTHVNMTHRRSLDPNFVYQRPKSPPLSSDQITFSIAERILSFESVQDTETASASSSQRMSEDEDGVSVGLSRSGSVSEKASMWNKLEQESKQQAQQYLRKTPKVGVRSRVNRNDVNSRFSTQPVTLGEVEQARRNNQALESVDEAEDEPSRLSLAERVRLFSGAAPNALPPAPRHSPPHSRPQPILHSATSSIVAGLLKNLKDKADGGVSVLKKKKEDRSSDDESAVKTTGADSREGSVSDSDVSSDETTLSLSPQTTLTTKEMVGGAVVSRCDDEVHADEGDGALVGSSIADRLAALHRSGTSDWKKRIKPLDNEEVSGGDGGVAERRDRLETASHGWKSRIGDKDADKFTVAGRMASLGVRLPQHQPICTSRTPTPQVFTPSHVGIMSTPASPESTNHLEGFVKRSASAPTNDNLKLLMNGSGETTGPVVTVPEVCDDGFHSFFPGYQPCNSLSADKVDFEHISTSSSLLVNKKRVRAQRKHRSVNPLRALAQRSDLRTEYVEVRTGIADVELTRINLEKLKKRNPGLAVEALAGLASKEELTGVVLRKACQSPSVKQVAQWSHPLLLRIKGRRHPIATVVPPSWKSINEGDAFVLVTASQVFCWHGKLCNVMEKSRSSELALEVQNRRDLGCLSAVKVIQLDGSLHSSQHNLFWNILKLPKSKLDTFTGSASGHPEEDEMYESALSDSYRVYRWSEAKLVPITTSWGRFPKIDILNPAEVLVFDFVTEVYWWSGKQASLSDRRQGGRAAQELATTSRWTPSGLTWLDQELAPWKPPVYAVTQHMEPVIFRHKFTDWPDFIVNNHHKDENGFNVCGTEERSCDIKPILSWKPSMPDLIVEGSHLGRGSKYYDNETLRYYQVTTDDLSVWKIEDYSSVEMDEEDVGYFLDSNSYIIKWSYTITITGRELSGEPSKHQASGRSRVAYLTWQGKRAGLEGGAAALLAVGMEPSAPQLVIREGSEPPALQYMLPGPLVVFTSQDFPKMFLIEPGQDDNENVYLHEVEYSANSLRSGASLWILPSKYKSFLWHGSCTWSLHRLRSSQTVSKLLRNARRKFSLSQDIENSEIHEGSEPVDFLPGIDKRNLKEIDKEDENREGDMKMFELTEIKGTYSAVGVQPSRYNPEAASPWKYVYFQEELYNTQSQAVLVDAGKSCWLWLRCSTAPGQALTTLLSYASAKGIEEENVRVVTQGSEPAEFRCLFPWWNQDTSVIIPDGWSEGESRIASDEVAKLAIRTYPLDELTKQPLPAGVDPTRLELYIDPKQFKDGLGVTKEDFDLLPRWKQKKLKKLAGLF